jgi:hypothetical protein
MLSAKERLSVHGKRRRPLRKGRIEGKGVRKTGKLEGIL